MDVRHVMTLLDGVAITLTASFVKCRIQFSLSSLG